MSGDKRDFFGKEVADAIREACAALGVAQERLAIEVVETGSTGIFGLIRKKAHIRAMVKVGGEEPEEEVFAVKAMLADSARAPKADDVEVFEEEEGGVEADVEVDATLDDEEEDEPSAEDPGEEALPENLEVVREELSRMVTLMGMPAELSLAADGLNVVCTLHGEYEEQLIGPDGKVLDSLQYLLRKLVSRRVGQRLKISLNVGEFREKRLDELKARAVALAAQVKESGKTQILPALNPSERRAVHMVLQEDKEIRSRSVGDGLFKKILIYKPGSKGSNSSRPSGRRRPQPKGKGQRSGQDPREEGEA